ASLETGSSLPSFVNLVPSADGACAVWRADVGTQHFQLQDVKARRIRNGQSFSLDWAGPVTVASSLFFQRPVTVTGDEIGVGPLIGWFSGSQAFAQKVDLFGCLSWHDGAPACTRTGGKLLATLGKPVRLVAVAPDGLGGVVGAALGRNDPDDFGDLYGAWAKSPNIPVTITTNFNGVARRACPHGD